MNQQTTETAAFPRRIVSRALLVLGGVLAGTAAVIVLSSASASADTGSTGPSQSGPSQPAPTGSRLDTAEPPARPAVDRAGLVDGVAGTVRGVLSLVDLEPVEQVRDAAQRTADRLADLMEAPVARLTGQNPTHGQAEKPVEQPDPDGCPDQVDVPSDPAGTAVPAGSEASAQRTALDSASDRSLLNPSWTVTPSRSGDTDRPVHLPAAPASVPASGHCPGPAAGGADSPVLGARQAPDRARSSAAVAVRPAAAYLPLRPDAQPGVTPD